MDDYEEVEFIQSLEHFKSTIEAKYDKSDSYVQIDEETRRSMITEAIEHLLVDILTSVSQTQHPRLQFPNRRSWNNASEIYYKNVELCVSQTAVDSIVDSLASLWRVPRFWLNVVASSKGFVAGPLHFVDAEGKSIDCSAKGTLIPSNIADITDFRTTARWGLIVEKDATFQALLDADWTKHLGSCLFITGKGFPDINTRHFVKRLWQTLKIPLFALVDADPHGIEIMCVYRFGSLAQAHDATNLTCTAIRWLGIFPTEIKSLAQDPTSLLTLTKTDQLKAQSLLRRPYIVDNPKLTEQVSAILTNERKAEIECLSTSFLCQVYLPEKIRNQRWL